MNKKIGIVGWKTGDNSYGVTLPYLWYFQMFGEAVVIKYDEAVRFDLDLVVIPGGPDVNTKRYNQVPGLLTTKPCIYREHFDEAIMPQYIENNVPVFGVCRGHQSICVSYGAKLIQHMNHETNSVDDRNKDVHQIIYKKRDIGNLVRAGCNSIHHQVVSDIDFPDDLKVIARHLGRKNNSNDTSGLIEAIVHRHLPIASVQFHPEELYVNSFTNNIIDCLLETPEEVNNMYEEINKDAKFIYGKNKIKKSFS